MRKVLEDPRRKSMNQFGLIGLRKHPPTIMVLTCFDVLHCYHLFTELFPQMCSKQFEGSFKDVFERVSYWMKTGDSSYGL